MKWLADRVTESRRFRREDQLRFAAEKRVAYIRALQRIIVMRRTVLGLSEHVSKLAEVRQRLETGEAVEDQLEKLWARVEKDQRELDAVAADLDESSATLAILSPKMVREAATLAGTVRDAEPGARYTEAFEHFIRVAQADLGLSKPKG